MSLQEQKRFILSVVSVITMAVYALIVYNGYQAGNYDTSNLFQFYARVTLLYVPITIAVHIITMILFAIVHAVSNEIKGEEQENVDFADERDRLIELKAGRISLVFFALGFMLALGFLAMGNSAHYFFLTIAGFGIVSEIAETGLTIFYYRRGV